ncbi:hypothetical protein [Pseudomonas shirazensis]
MDNNNIDFKDLWKKQSVGQPNIEEVLARLKQFKKGALRTLWITNILLFATCAFILFIWYYYQPEFISTKIGIVLTILAMVIYLVVYNRLLGTYKNIDATQTNQQYLQKLILIKRKQQFLQSKILSLYFVLLGVGISLYMYEYTSRMTLFFGVLTYVLLFVWIAIAWFFLRPKEIKKHETKLNSLIARFEDINKQLDIE